jgi:hypothetical protein
MASTKTTMYKLAMSKQSALLDTPDPRNSGKLCTSQPSRPQSKAVVAPYLCIPHLELDGFVLGLGKQQLPLQQPQASLTFQHLPQPGQ